MASNALGLMIPMMLANLSSKKGEGQANISKALNGMQDAVKAQAIASAMPPGLQSALAQNLSGG
jgi:hypothetical protein